MTSTVNEAIENLEQVVETKNPIETEGVMDHVMADAYIDSEKVDKHLQEITDELNERAEAVVLDPPADNAEAMPKSIYTDKLKLEEDFAAFTLKEETLAPVKDGRSHRQAARDENEGNKFLDYDMFMFIHELFAGQNCNTNPAPKTPIIYGRIINRKTKEVTYGMRPMRKFMDSGVENRQVDAVFRDFGTPQVAVDINNRIVISAAEREDLNDVIAACEIFHLKHDNPEASRGSSSHWPWRINVYYPTDSRGKPRGLEDYLTSIGKTIDEVMFPDFARGYAKEVEKRAAKKAADKEASKKAAEKVKKIKEDELDRYFNDPKFNELFDKAVTAAANDDEPLKDHANELIADLQNAGITFKRQAVIDLFMAEFNDEYIEEE